MANVATAESVGLLYVLGAGLVVTIFALAVLAVLRPRFPQVYQFRRHLSQYRAYDTFNDTPIGFPAAELGAGPLGWLGPTLATPEDEVLRTVGLDAAMFIRFVRSQLATFAVLTAFCCLLLWPLYATGPRKSLPDTDPNYVAGFNILSLSNVDVKNQRIWVTLVAEHVVAAIVMYFLYRDYSQYALYRREYHTAENPSNYTVVVYDIPKDMNTEAAVRQRFERIFPNQVAEVHIARAAGEGVRAQNKLDKVVAQKELAEFIHMTTGTEPEHRPGMFGSLMRWKKRINSLKYYVAEEARLKSEILAQGESAAYARSAIVMFTNRRAASLIVQANQGSNGDEWTVERACEPEAVHWPALHIPGYQVVWREVAVGLFLVLLTLSWIFLVPRIIGLSNISKTAKRLSPGVSVLIETLLSYLLLSVFFILFPFLIRASVERMRLHSHHLVEGKTRNYFYIFTIFGCFVFVDLGTSGLDYLKSLVNGLPKRGLYFASLVLITALFSIARDLLNPGRVIRRWIMLKLAQTERQRRAADEGSSEFSYLQKYSTCMMVSLWGICFTTLAPLVTLCVMLFYLSAYVTFKHNIIFTCHRRWDGGGGGYPGAFWGVLAGLMIKQVFMIGVFCVYQVPAEAVLAVLPLISSILFGVWCHHQFNRMSLHGCLFDQYTAEPKAKGEIDEFPTRYHGLYAQPGISLEPYQNLSGSEDPHVLYPAGDNGRVD